MTGDAFGRGSEVRFCFGAVAFHTAILYRQKNIRALRAAPRDLMAGFTIGSANRDVFGMIEIGLQQTGGI